jgi:hypothetical protein
MQQGDRTIELHLGVFGTGDGKVNCAHGVAGMLLNPASRSTCAAAKQEDHQSGSEVQEDRTTCPLH